MMSPPDDVSITATDATVAGSSVAATEAYDDDDDDDDDEINVCPAPSPPAGPDDDGASPPATLTIANNPPPTPSSAASSTPPGHLLDQARGLHTGHSHHHTPESIDPDILLDGMGLRDLDACATMEGVQELLRMHHHSNSHHLPALNERMSEEEIYDEGAFRDLQYAAKATAAAAEGGTSPPSGGGDGGGGGVGGGDSPPKTSHSLRGSVISGASVRSLQLNTLDEEEEDLEDDDDPTILNGAIPPGVEVPSSIMEELIASEERRKSFDCDEPGDDDEGAASQVDLADDAEILR
jgi:hypothetical protein